MRITKIERRLSDGSSVYDVSLEIATQWITLECCSERDACALIDRVHDAVEKHTNELVTLDFAEWTR